MAHLHQCFLRVLDLLTGGRLLYLSFLRTQESRLFDLQSKINLDAGLRRHDELWLRLKARDFSHTRGNINELEPLLGHAFQLFLL
jgi:hypothetical protein